MSQQKNILALASRGLRSATLLLILADLLSCVRYGYQQPDPTEGDSGTCSGHGTYIENHKGDYACVCDPGYMPGGNGRCVLASGAADAGPDVGSPISCDDQNPCTTDVVNADGTCTQNFNSATCDDGDPCTAKDTCAQGTCQGLPLDQDADGFVAKQCGGDDCDDTNRDISPGAYEATTGGAVCTDTIDNDCDGLIDQADPGCLRCQVDQDCDDQNLCNGQETCRNNDCLKGTALTCDDANPCTDDRCDAKVGCLQQPNTAPCDDQLPCTSGDICTQGTCAGTAYSCDDKNVCTDDTCQGDGSCSYRNNAATCDDGDLCTSKSACSVGLCRGTVDKDSDKDGFIDSTCAGGTDCNDANASVNPQQSEGLSVGTTCSDTLDNDCDGQIDQFDAQCAPKPATKIYWADQGSHRISRANVDGTNIEAIVTSGIDSPDGLALDLINGKIYWDDYGNQRIQRANLDGTNVENLITTGLDDPWGIALDLGAGKMYWIDSGTRKIQRANLDGSTIESLISSGLRSPHYPALDLGAGKIYWTDHGSNKIQRANLNGSNVEDLVTSNLVTPYGIALDLKAGKIYWADAGRDQIRRANLNGSNVETAVSGLVSPYGIALDLVAGKIYWTDYGSNKIQRANLDGTNIEDLITSGVRDPNGIALQ